MRLLFVLVAAVLTSCATSSPPDDLERRTAINPLTPTSVGVTANVSGLTHPAHLKPLILRRAALAARSAGFTGLRIEEAEVWYQFPGEIWWAGARVGYLREPFADDPGAVYAVAEVLDPKLAVPRDKSALASIAGSNTSSSTVAWQNLRPMFMDTVLIDDSSIASFAYGTRVYVRPGRNQLLATVSYALQPDRIPRDRFVPLQLTLRPGHHYRLVGTPLEDGFELWVEDIESPTEKLARTVIPLISK